MGYKAMNQLINRLKNTKNETAESNSKASDNWIATLKNKTNQKENKEVERSTNTKNPIGHRGQRSISSPSVFPQETPNTEIRWKFETYIHKSKK